MQNAVLLQSSPGGEAGLWPELTILPLTPRPAAWAGMKQAVGLGLARSGPEGNQGRGNPEPEIRIERISGQMTETGEWSFAISGLWNSMVPFTQSIGLTASALGYVRSA